MLMWMKLFWQLFWEERRFEKMAHLFFFFSLGHLCNEVRFPLPLFRRSPFASLTSAMDNLQSDK